MAELSTLARPYAKAAFEYASDQGWLASWETMLATAARVSGQEKVSALLASPSHTAQQQAEIFIALCGDELTFQVGNFIHLLAENKRLALLPHISEQFSAMKAQREQTVDVDITTAFELNPLEAEILANSLSDKLQRSVNVQAEVDKSLIGGVVVRAGDMVIDGSVRGKLAKLSEAISH
jgi:F-type H+-transporting ATPase subunit delta